MKEQLKDETYHCNILSNEILIWIQNKHYPVKTGNETLIPQNFFFREVTIQQITLADIHKFKENILK